MFHSLCVCSLQATSVSVLAWLHDDAFSGNVRLAMEWIVSRCAGGRFGSTQGTVLALKAIIAYDKATARPKTAGRLVVSVDGVETDHASYDEHTEGVITFDTSKVCACCGSVRVMLVVPPWLCVSLCFIILETSPSCSLIDTML